MPQIACLRQCLSQHQITMGSHVKVLRVSLIQGYLTNKKATPSLEQSQNPKHGPSVGSWEEAPSYHQSTPVQCVQCTQKQVHAGMVPSAKAGAHMILKSIHSFGSTSRPPAHP